LHQMLDATLTSTQNTPPEHSLISTDFSSSSVDSYWQIAQMHVK
jgi:hypothetical protein